MPDTSLPVSATLPSIRFGLRTLFWIVTAAGVMLTALLAAPMPGIGSLAIVLAAAVIGLHVAGTALGYHLRAQADDQIAHRSRSKSVGIRCGSAAIVTTPPSSWHLRGTALPRLPMLVSTGAVIGGGIGIAFLATAVGDRASNFGIFVGSFSTAVLGAWFTFLGCSFWTILRRGWREAIEHQNLDESRSRR